MTHTLSGLKVHTYTIYSDKSWSRDCHVAISYSMYGLLVHTCTINSDDVGGQRIGPSNYFDDVSEENFALQLFWYIVISHILSGLRVRTNTIYSDK